MLQVVLMEPEIPQNSGSIARMCAATGIGLHLVSPLGFSLDDRYLKRAGLDYWKDVCLGVHASLDAALDEFSNRPVHFYTKKAEKLYTEVVHCPDDVLVFGGESAGLPEWVLERFAASLVRIPIRNCVRSLNLSAAVHVATYRALETLGFPGILI